MDYWTYIPNCSGPNGVTAVPPERFMVIRMVEVDIKGHVMLLVIHSIVNHAMVLAVQPCITE